MVEDLLTIEELRARGQVIEHKGLPGNIIYPESTKCKWCKAYFSCSADMNSHIRAYGNHPHDKEDFEKLGHYHWTRSKYGEGVDVALAEKDPTLARAIRQNGEISLAQYTYSLSNDGKWLKRRTRNESY